MITAEHCFLFSPHNEVERSRLNDCVTRRLKEKNKLMLEWFSMAFLVVNKFIDCRINEFTLITISNRRLHLTCFLTFCAVLSILSTSSETKFGSMG